MFFIPISFVFIIDLIPVGLYLRKNSLDRAETPIRKPTYSDRIITFVLLISLLIPFSWKASNLTLSSTDMESLPYHMFDLVRAIPGSMGITVDRKVSYSGYVNKMAEQGKYFSVAKDRNIIVIQLESFRTF